MNKLDWTKLDMSYYGPIAIGIGILLGVCSLISTDFRGGPAEWLTGWTAWVASYVALAVATHSFIKLTNIIAKRLQYGKDDGRNWTWN